MRAMGHELITPRARQIAWINVKLPTRDSSHQCVATQQYIRHSVVFSFNMHVARRARGTKVVALF